MKKYDIINSFNPDVPDENFFIFPNLLIVEKSRSLKLIISGNGCFLYYNKDDRTLHTSQRCVPCRGF
nr:MAG TPA: hypothetical protein [Caudoviricetes sp.]